MAPSGGCHQTLPVSTQATAVALVLSRSFLERLLVLPDANMTGGRSWVIPWMEDDLSLASAEIWVNRTLEWANQAAEMKVDGLLGLMWRTWETSPQIKAMARAGWEETAGTLTDTAFWHDFCSTSFGSESADQCEGGGAARPTVRLDPALRCDSGERGRGRELRRGAVCA